MVVAAYEVVLYLGEALRVKQVVNHGLISTCRAGLQLVAARAEPGAAEEVGHERDIGRQDRLLQ